MENDIEQRIKGDNNDQSINKTENSNNLNQEVNTLLCMENKTVNQYVQISESPDINDLIKVCTLCLSNREPIIIEKASKKAMERVNFLADELRIILKEQIVKSEKINELMEDPNFVFFLKNIQTATIKSRDNNEIKTLAELISMRLKTESSSMVELSIDEAVNIIPKLLPIHFKMLGLIYILKEIHLGSSNLDNLLDIYESFIDMFIDVKQEFKSTTFTHLEYTKCARISSIKFNSNIIDFIYSEYYEYVNKGVPISHVPMELSLLMQKYNIPFKLKNGNAQILIIDKKTFNKAKEHISSDDILIFNKYLNDNISKDDLIKEIKSKHNKLYEFSDWWNNSTLSSMNLTNVGITIAIAYINSTTDWNLDYEIWL